MDPEHPMILPTAAALFWIIMACVILCVLCVVVAPQAPGPKHCQKHKTLRPGICTV